MDNMFAEENFKVVIERRKRKLSPYLLQCSVFDVIYSGELNKVWEQLNTKSCLKRNWEGLAISLISPDIVTIDRISNCDNKAESTILTWLETNEQGSFDELLEAMVNCQVYSAADELLIYLESVDHDEKMSLSEIPEPKPVEDDEMSLSAISVPEPQDDKIESEQAVTQASQRKRFKFRRSISWQSWQRITRRFPWKRSKSCPPSIDQDTSNHISTIPPAPPQPVKKRDGILIVSTNEDSQTLLMKNLFSFVEKLERGWRVTTIHDLPGGPMATAWLADQVETALYVLICFSEKMKEVLGNSEEFPGQSQCNLKFTLDCLVTGKLYNNMCYNHGGKFLPILLYGNNASCMSIMQSLNLFKIYTWPNEKIGIKKYLLNLPERTPPPVGQRIPLVPRRLP